MSGGSYDYFCFKVDEVADLIRVDARGCGYADRMLRQLFVEHLRKVAKALRAIEWNDSGDGDDEEQALIRACVAPEPIPDTLRTALVRDIETAKGALETARVVLLPKEAP